MKKVKTTININSELWKRFSHLVIEERGYRKKNEIIEQFIREYVQRSEGKESHKINKAIILAEMSRIAGPLGVRRGQSYSAKEKNKFVILGGGEAGRAAAEDPILSPPRVV